MATLTRHWVINAPPGNVNKDWCSIPLNILTIRHQSTLHAERAPMQYDVIIVGGGPYPGNNLWDATRTSASQAYWTLYYKGFTKEKLYYLSADTEQDIRHGFSALLFPKNSGSPPPFSAVSEIRYIFFSIYAQSTPCQVFFRIAS